MGANLAEARADLQPLASLVAESSLYPWDDLTLEQRSRMERAIAPGTIISGMVAPATQSELAAVMRYAHEHRWRVLPCGGCSKLDWGGLVGEPIAKGEQNVLIALSTERLTQVIEHAIGDLTVTVEAGMKFTALQALLAQAGQFLAIDPADPDQATIGGIVATADTGSLRQRYNSVRDMLLGLSVVRADGQLAKAGGRVVKNVAGYDLMKLFAGSYGTLGIISQVTFRVYPLPEASQTVVLSGAADAIAQATATLLSSALTPVAADLLSPSVVERLDSGKGLGLVVQFQGIQPSVEEQINRMVELGQALGLATVTLVANEAALWQPLRSHMTVPHRGDAITGKIGVSPSAAVDVFTQVDALLGDRWLGQVHIASGLGRFVLHDGTIDPKALLKVRTLFQAERGFLSVLQAPPALKQQLDVWGYSGNALALMQTLKQQFDPNHLLSPHRFVGGI